MGFEPTRGDPNGLAVHRLNHSATSSSEQLAIFELDSVVRTINYYELLTKSRNVSSKN